MSSRRRVLGLTGALLALATAALARPTHRPRRTAPPVVSLLTGRRIAVDPPLPQVVSEAVVHDLVDVAHVAPRLAPSDLRDPDGWQRWGRASPWDQQRAVRAVVDALATRGVDLGVAAAILAIARVESGLNPWARNPRSTACGVFQFVRATWDDYGAPPDACLDPATNARVGVAHLTGIYDRLVKATVPPPADLADPVQRAEWIFRGLYAYHYHGVGFADAATGGLVDAQVPAENGIAALRAFHEVLRRATLPPVRVVRRPTRRPPVRATGGGRRRVLLPS